MQTAGDMSSDENTRDIGPLRRSATAPLRRSREPTFSRAEHETSTSRNRGRTVSSRIRNQDAAISSPHPPAVRRVTTRDSERMRRIEEERVAPRASTSTQRLRQSSSAVRQRRFTAASARARGVTTTSVRRPSLAYTTGRHGDPSFSLAGPQETLPANQPYVHPAYTDLNPEYENPVNARPVWGLAKPLPRVVRPGMVPTVSELRHNVAESHEPERMQSGGQAPDIDLEDGREEPSLKLGKVTSQLERARERRESRLLARIASDVEDMHVTSNEPRPMLTPPSEVEEEDEHDSEDGDVGMVPFPKLDDVPEGGEEPTPLKLQFSISPGTRPTELAPQTHVGYDEGYASTIEEDLKDDPDLIAQELRKIEANDYEEIHNDHTHWSVYRTQFREPLAELLAVIIQLTIGFCADLAATTSSSGADTSWAWGLATMTAVYIAGGISGAHLNPAISIMLYIYRGFPLRKVPIYIAAQILGAFIATFIAYGLYRKDIVAFGGSSLAASGTASSFITYPRYDWIDPATAFFTEFIGTAFLAVAVLALGDDSNAPPGAGMSAFIIGLIVTVLSMAFSHNTGAALNPSRDFGPRLALLAIGYGGSNLFDNGYWVYGPWVATILGAIFGALVYDVAIFVGGESPVNYPRRRMKRAGKKWRRKWTGRLEKTRARVGKKAGEEGKTRTEKSRF